MNFNNLLEIAQVNKNAKSITKGFSTAITPAKKPPKSNVQSEAVRKFLEKREQMERQKDIEARKQKDRLLMLRAQNSKSNKAAKLMSSRTKDNDFSKIRLTEEQLEVKQKMEAQIQRRMLTDKVERMKERIRIQELEDATPHKRKRKHKSTTETEIKSQSLLDILPEKKIRLEGNWTSVKPKENIKKFKTGKTPSGPLSFNELLKIAADKQKSNVESESEYEEEDEDENQGENERLMTVKERKKFLEEQNHRSKGKTVSSRESVQGNTNVSSRKSIDNHDKNRIPKNRQRNSDNNVSKNQPMPHNSRLPTSQSSRPPLPQNSQNYRQSTAQNSQPSLMQNSRPPMPHNSRQSVSQSSRLTNSQNGRPSNSQNGRPLNSQNSRPSNSQISQSNLRLNSNSKPELNQNSRLSNSNSKMGPPFSANAQRNERPQRPISSESKIVKAPSRPSNGLTKDTVPPSRNIPLTKEKLNSKTIPSYNTQPKQKPSNLNQSGKLSSERSNVRRNPSNNDLNRPQPSTSKSSSSLNSKRSDVKSNHQSARDEYQNVPSYTTNRKVEKPKAAAPPRYQNVEVDIFDEENTPSYTTVNGHGRNNAFRNGDSRPSVSQNEDKKYRTNPFTGSSNKQPASSLSGAQYREDIKRIAPVNKRMINGTLQQPKRSISPSTLSQRAGPMRHEPNQPMRHEPNQPMRHEPNQPMRHEPYRPMRHEPYRPMRHDPYPPSKALARNPYRKLPPITSSRPQRRIESDDEEDEDDDEMKDFIDDDPIGDMEDYSQQIQEIFGYDKNRYLFEEDLDDEAMESSYAEQMKEELRSARLGFLEDLEDIRKEAEERKMKKKKRV